MQFRGQFTNLKQQLCSQDDEDNRLDSLVTVAVMNIHTGGGKGGSWGVAEGSGKGGKEEPSHISPQIYMYMSLYFNIWRVYDQNGVSLLYNMLETHHSRQKPSIYIAGRGAFQYFSPMFFTWKSLTS